MARLQIVSVKINIYGNCVCKVGTSVERDYGNDFDAKVWLAAKIKSGHPVSKGSDFQAADVAKFAELV
ncbi:MAG TPA: hypothetical protein VF681_05810 [Abditibacteriaceae bacterium]|jgi:hypothetical protein